MAPQLLRTAESRTSGFRCTSALPVICLHVVGRPGNPQSIAPHHHIGLLHPPHIRCVVAPGKSREGCCARGLIGAAPTGRCDGPGAWPGRLSDQFKLLNHRTPDKLRCFAVDPALPVLAVDAQALEHLGAALVAVAALMWLAWREHRHGAAAVDTGHVLLLLAPALHWGGGYCVASASAARFSASGPHQPRPLHVSHSSRNGKSSEPSW